MHTVGFAEQQKRLLFCPRPLSVESKAKQYEGINELIRSGRAESFQADNYPVVLKRICEHRDSLISSSFPQPKTPIRPTSEQPSLGFRESTEVQDKMDTDLIHVLAHKFVSAGLNEESRFEAIVNAVRNRLFSLSHTQKDSLFRWTAQLVFR